MDVPTVTARQILESNAKAAAVYIRLRERLDGRLPLGWSDDLDRLVEAVYAAPGPGSEGENGR